MTWKAYEVTVIDDSDSQIGKKEILKELAINETIPDTYKTSLLDVPGLTFNYGLHKLVFR